MSLMRIGKLARETNVSVDTLRFYERRGVLPPPAREASGYRVYQDDAVWRVQMTKWLQGLGFTLEEVVDALQAFDADGATCASEKHRLVSVLSRIDDKLSELQRVRRKIATALQRCDEGDCAAPSRPKKRKSSI